MRVPRTFCFVDLTGFTNFTAEQGDDAAAKLLSAFRSVARDVASTRGVRVAKWLGDGLMVVAVEQADAVAFALDLEHQASECCTPLSLRIGIASGFALLFEGDDYIGSAVNLASRLCDAAGPGEVLLPADQLSELPAGALASPVISVQVPGFAEPIEVVELSGDPAPAAYFDTGELWDAHTVRGVTTLPTDFTWGAVVNGAAAGMAPASDWRSWEAAGRLPPSGDGNGFGTQYAEDLALIAEQGLGAVRLTVDWARLVPAAGRVDGPATEELGRVLDAAAGNGVAVWATLHDLAVPGWFLDEGGFADDRARIWWSRWVELAADLVGDRVAGWFPLVEPVTWAMDGYLRGITPPGRRDPEVFAETLRGLHLAWRDAWRILRGGGPPVATAHRVGSVHTADTSVPARQQARMADDVLWGSWVSGLRDGILRIPGLADEEVPDLADSGDLLGITYLGSLAVDGEGAFRPYPADARIAESGWAPWPEGLAVTLRRLADELPGRPLIVAGQGVGTSDDELRSDVLRESVEVLTVAVADGIDVRGWFHRSAIDGYEGVSGFQVPWGLFDRDRNPKPSALALAEAVRTAPAA